METFYTTKVIRVGTSKAVVIPVPVLTGLGWERGDNVIFTLGYDDTLIIKKIDDASIRRLKDAYGQNEEPTINI